MLNSEKIKISKNPSKFLPEVPGIYIFWAKDKPIYVGKALNLKIRVSSYFRNDLQPKTFLMIQKAQYLSYIKVISELEALLLEAKLIKLYKPTYNSSLKDDKSPLYIRITSDFYPLLLTARKDQLKLNSKIYFGPFTSSSSVRFVLKALRRIFPYADHKLGKKKCIYAHIGLCNPCPNEIEQIESLDIQKVLRRKYLRNINLIRRILSGNIDKVQKDLENKMNILSKNQKYEEAISIREALTKFNYIIEPTYSISEFLKNPNFTEDIQNQEINELKLIVSKYLNIQSGLKRIECYDIAHLAGTFPTASMVTFIGGQKEPSLYRHFRVKRAKSYDDLSALKEVILRRIKHFNSWGKPDLIIVDGGKPQVSLFSQILESYKIPVMGIAKRYEALVFPVKQINSLSFIEIRLKRGFSRNLVLRLRDEAHRFARRYHHHLIQKSFTPNFLDIAKLRTNT